MSEATPLVDFHTHRKKEADNIIEVISFHEKIDRPCSYYTIGFHPWRSAALLSHEEINNIRLLYTKDDRCIGLGECGLDSLRGADIEIQEEIFKQQIFLANELEAPVVVHCVRSFDRILRLRKMYGMTPWAIHGFRRNKILASQIIDAGCYLSVAPDMLMQESFIGTLKYVPADRIFIETDSSTGLDIESRYNVLATIRGIDCNYLKNIIYRNFSTFYFKKWKHLSG